MAEPGDQGGPSPADLPSMGGDFFVAVDEQFMGLETGSYPLRGLLEIDSETGNTHHNEVYFQTSANRFAIVPLETVEDELVAGGVLDLTGGPSDADHGPNAIEYVLIDWNESRSAGHVSYTHLSDEALNQVVLSENEPYDPSDPNPVTGRITAVDTNDWLDGFDLEELQLPRSTVRDDFWNSMQADWPEAQPRNLQEPGPQDADARSWRAIVGLGGLDEMSALNLEHDPAWPPTAANQLIQVSTTYFIMLGSRHASLGNLHAGSTVDLGPSSDPSIPSGEQAVGQSWEFLDDKVGAINWGDDLMLFTRSQDRLPVENPPSLTPNTLGIQLGEDSPLTFTMTIPAAHGPVRGQEVSYEQELPPRFTIGSLDPAHATPEAFQRAIEELRHKRPELAGLLDPVYEVLAHASECPRNDDGAYQMTDEQMDIIRTEFLPATLDPDRMPPPTNDARWNHPYIMPPREA